MYEQLLRAGKQRQEESRGWDLCRKDGGRLGRNAAGAVAGAGMWARQQRIYDRAAARLAMPSAHHIGKVKTGSAFTLYTWTAAGVALAQARRSVVASLLGGRRRRPSSGGAGGGAGLGR
eukprot:359988-Chlamydomonas_euryale.AAC.2